MDSHRPFKCSVNIFLSFFYLIFLLFSTLFNPFLLDRLTLHWIFLCDLWVWVRPGGNRALFPFRSGAFLFVQLSVCCLPLFYFRSPSRSAFDNSLYYFLFAALPPFFFCSVYHSLFRFHSAAYPSFTSGHFLYSVSDNSLFCCPPLFCISGLPPTSFVLLPAFCLILCFPRFFIIEVCYPLIYFTSVLLLFIFCPFLNPVNFPQLFCMLICCQPATNLFYFSLSLSLYFRSPFAFVTSGLLPISTSGLQPTHFRSGVCRILSLFTAIYEQKTLLFFSVIILPLIPLICPIRFLVGVAPLYLEGTVLCTMSIGVPGRYFFTLTYKTRTDPCK